MQGYDTEVTLKRRLAALSVCAEAAIRSSTDWVVVVTSEIAAGAELHCSSIGKSCHYASNYLWSCGGKPAFKLKNSARQEASNLPLFIGKSGLA